MSEKSERAPSPQTVFVHTLYACGLLSANKDCTYWVNIIVLQNNIRLSSTTGCSSSMNPWCVVDPLSATILWNMISTNSIHLGCNKKAVHSIRCDLASIQAKLWKNVQHFLHRTQLGDLCLWTLKFECCHSSQSIQDIIEIVFDRALIQIIENPERLIGCIGSQPKQGHHQTVT